MAIDLMADAFDLFNRPDRTIETQEGGLDDGERVVGKCRSMPFRFRVTS